MMVSKPDSFLLSTGPFSFGSMQIARINKNRDGVKKVSENDVLLCKKLKSLRAHKWYKLTNGTKIIFFY